MGLFSNPSNYVPKTQGTDSHSPLNPESDNSNRFRFPQQIWQQLDGIDLKLCEEIAFLSRCQAKKSPTGARYCCPSEAYLSKKIGVRRETISDHVRKLEKLGVLHVLRRRKKGGQWQTNLYKLIKWVHWLVSKALAPLRGRPPRVTEKSHISIPKRENESMEEAKGGASHIKGTLMQLYERIRRGEKID